MEHVHGKRKSSEIASQDFISNMPDNVITNILDRLPIQDAVKTGILSRDWRFKWTLLTQLVFDHKFFDNLPNKYDVKNLSRLLLHLKGPVKKFDLYMPYNEITLDVEDVNHWILFLSRKGIEELKLTNIPEIPHKLPTHIYSCMELKRLELYDCCFWRVPSFRGFPNLLSLDLFDVEFKGYTCGEFIARCPLLENLIITGDNTVGHAELVEISKLGNLKVLSLSLCILQDKQMITSSSIFQLTALPKLQELDLDFRYCQFLAEDDVLKKVPLTFYSLKTLTICPIDFSSDIMLSFASKMICNSPILRNLNITCTDEHIVPPHAICSLDSVCNKMGKLQLQSVMFSGCKGSENELCFMKSLLACSPLLKQIIIMPFSSSFSGTTNDTGNLIFAQKLLKLHRASPIAEIIFS